MQLPSHEAVVGLLSVVAAVDPVAAAELLEVQLPVVGGDLVGA